MLGGAIHCAVLPDHVTIVICIFVAVILWKKDQGEDSHFYPDIFSHKATPNKFSSWPVLRDKQGMINAPQIPAVRLTNEDPFFARTA